MCSSGFIWERGGGKKEKKRKTNQTEEMVVSYLIALRADAAENGLGPVLLTEPRLLLQSADYWSQRYEREEKR